MTPFVFAGAIVPDAVIEEHVCSGMAVEDGWRVYFDEGDWKAEIVPDDWLIVTHCPWCGTRLSTPSEES